MACQETPPHGKDQNNPFLPIVLDPDPVQEKIADIVYNRSKQILPQDLIAKLSTRHEKKGHYINYVRYCRHPVTISLNQENRIRQLHEWGTTFAKILKKIADQYKTNKDSYCRKSIENTLVRYLPDHLASLMEQYRTGDDLAGAHLGDDNFNWKSIEWNLGAVGGLEEGYAAAMLLGDPGVNFRPIETPFSQTLKDMLMWAYEAHCAANKIPMKASPLIACVEHDDLYGSTVAICRSLSDIGCTVRLCFDKELKLDRQSFLLLGNEKIDMVYLDCHLENLSKHHPIIQALRNNRVALDGSVFSRLILRSKVILALLFDNGFVSDIQLTPHELKMIKQHLVPTYLWQKKTFKDVFSDSRALSMLFSSMNGKGGQFAGNPGGKPSLPLVIKEAIGPVFGGSGVSVLFEKKGRYPVKETRELLKKHIKHQIIPRTTIRPDKLSADMYHPLKTFLEKILRLRMNPLNKTFISSIKKSYYLFIDDTLSHSKNCVFLDRFQPDIEALLLQFHTVNVNKLDPVGKKHHTRFQKGIKRLFVKPDSDREKVFSRLITLVDSFLTAVEFSRQNGIKKINNLLQSLSKTGKEKNAVGFKPFFENLTKQINIFLKSNHFNALSALENKDIHDMLEKHFIQHCLQLVLPIVIQEFTPPLKWQSDPDIYFSNRIHAIITKSRIVTFVSGTQLFELSRFKQKNNTKMTTSLRLGGI